MTIQCPKYRKCSKNNFLLVLVPPNIEDSLTSTDIVAREGSNVTLKCKATGSPTPSLKWKRYVSRKTVFEKKRITSFGGGLFFAGMTTIKYRLAKDQVVSIE